MALYKQAAQAQKLIDQVARESNLALRTVTTLGVIRNDLLSLGLTDRNIVIQAITDMGYDAPEIQTLLGKWNTVLAAVTAEGIVTIDR